MLSWREVIDGSDERELGFVRRLRHHAVRRTVRAGVERLGRSWSSHTFIEVLHPVVQ